MIYLLFRFVGSGLVTELGINVQKYLHAVSSLKKGKFHLQNISRWVKGNNGDDSNKVFSISIFLPRHFGECLSRLASFVKRGIFFLLFIVYSVFFWIPPVSLYILKEKQ